ncbi:MAG: LysR family transcriptional regulator, partial [Clostridia bacterium]|nr:LysR family transcriptional regulator [Clostridia bacterium]
RVTDAGEEFLQYARRILNQVDELESLYREGHRCRQRFSLSAPRAGYIAEAFAAFTSEIRKTESAEFFFRETDSMHTIDNVCGGEFRLGIVRYPDAYEDYFAQTFAAKNLHCESVIAFASQLLVSKRSSLAEKRNVCGEDLQDHIEVIYDNPCIPLPPADAKRDPKRTFFTVSTDKHIHVHDRGSQLALLHANPDTFMWVTPMPHKLLEKYQLVQRPFFGAPKYRDVLITRKDYTLTDTDEKFISVLKQSVRRCFS